MSDTHFDIIVIGGGPAGSSAARWAAQLGARTLLLERHRMPRPKLCGGWVSNYALSLLDFVLPDSVIESHFKRARLHFRDTGQTYAAPETFGVFVDRGRFDAHLYGKAGEAGAICACESVVDLKVETQPYTVRTDRSAYTAGGIVCATGANSRLTRILRPADKPHEWAIAVEQRLPVTFADRWGLQPGDAYLHFGVVDFGYAWALHHGAYLLVGVGARRDKAPDIRTVLAELWREWRLPSELFACQGHPIPLGGNERVVGVGRVLAVGDAAGMVDAFNGEGIAGAIHSGQIAAEALVAHPGDKAARQYRRRLDKAWFGELRMSRRTAQLFYSLPDAIVRGFCTHTQIAEQYNAVLQRRATYGRFLRWLLKRRLWRGAAKEEIAT